MEVEGESAFPELIPGRYYLASSLKRPRVGRFVVFPNPLSRGQILVKKVESLEDDFLRVRGTVSWGSSSDNFGKIFRKNVIGVVL